LIVRNHVFAPERSTVLPKHLLGSTTIIPMVPLPSGATSLRMIPPPVPLKLSLTASPSDAKTFSSKLLSRSSGPLPVTDLESLSPMVALTKHYRGLRLATVVVTGVVALAATGVVAAVLSHQSSQEPQYSPHQSTTIRDEFPPPVLLPGLVAAQEEEEQQSATINGESSPPARVVTPRSIVAQEQLPAILDIITEPSSPPAPVMTPRAITAEPLTTVPTPLTPISAPQPQTPAVLPPQLLSIVDGDPADNREDERPDLQIARIDIGSPLAQAQSDEEFRELVVQAVLREFPLPKRHPGSSNVSTTTDGSSDDDRLRATASSSAESDVDGAV